MFVLSGVKKRYYEFQAPDNKQVLHIEPPKLKTLNRMNDLSRPDSTPKAAAEVVARVIERPKLTPPSNPETDGEGVPFALCSASEKLVSEYAGIPLPAVYDLDIITFWALLRDGVIYNRAQTETGRKWLRNAWRITQTEPETEKLKAKYGERGN